MFKNILPPIRPNLPYGIKVGSLNILLLTYVQYIRHIGTGSGLASGSPLLHFPPSSTSEVLLCHHCTMVKISNFLDGSCFIVPN